MPKKSPQPILHKFAFQASYKPYLEFYNLLYSATQKLSGYEHWETNRLYVFLHDQEKHCTLAVKHNFFSYEWDFSGTSDYIDDVRNSLEILPTSLELKRFKRLGFRQHFLIPVNMKFEEINNILNLKFLSQDERLTNLFPSGTTDMLYVAVGSDDELEFRIVVGPMKREEISDYIQINQKYNFAPDKPSDYASVLSNYPDVSVYVDIDIFRRDEETGIPVGYGLTFLEKADNMMKGKLSALKEYIFEK